MFQSFMVILCAIYAGSRPKYSFNFQIYTKNTSTKQHNSVRQTNKKTNRIKNYMRTRSINRCAPEEAICLKRETFKYSLYWTCWVMMNVCVKEWSYDPISSMVEIIFKKKLPIFHI